MSHVTNVIVTAGPCEDDDALKHLGFVPVHDYVRGPKAMEMSVYLAALNHANTDGVCASIRQAGWADPEAVQIFVNEQDDFTFRENKA